jgi:hypothetical protein
MSTSNTPCGIAIPQTFSGSPVNQCDVASSLTFAPWPVIVSVKNVCQIWGVRQGRSKS